MQTQRQRLMFFNDKRTEMISATTKALGRNAEGVMTYEDPAATWNRIIMRELIDFNKYTFSGIENIN